jgi:hypothetical protein
MSFSYMRYKSQLDACDVQIDLNDKKIQHRSIVVSFQTGRKFNCAGEHSPNVDASGRNLGDSRK